MKKLLLPILAFLALSILPSCSEKFHVAAPYKAITVVYGLLDRADTAHYVRVQKAFLDDTKSALDMARVPDSSFFNNINVRVQKINMATGIGVRTDTFHLTRVDLNLEGYQKDLGAFFNSPNYAYKFKGTLDPSFLYRIIITNAATGEVDSADAPIIDNRAYSALTMYTIDDTSRNSEFDFTSTAATSKIDMNTSFIAPSNFDFQGRVTPAAVAQTFIRFNWVDSNTSTGISTARSYDYNLNYVEVPNTSSTFFTFTVANNAMYNAIKTAMGTAPPNIVRLMDRCELILYLGSTDFYNYIRVSAQQGTGLTGNEIQPSFTNLKGANVLGLFSSRTTRKGYVTISNGTINALKTLSLMADQRITGTVYH